MLNDDDEDVEQEITFPNECKLCKGPLYLNVIHKGFVFCCVDHAKTYDAQLRAANEGKQ